jgi:predicted ATPase
VKRELPAGTVTFLFTDIEGSTRLLHELGDDYAEVLSAHRRALRECFARHEGVEVDTQGDAFFVAFARASAALAAASDGQQALADGPIRVRMGLHTGEPVVTEEGYVGLDVHRAARIAAVGHGGQVLVSQSTCELLGLDGLRDLGEHRLKDLTSPEHIYQLGDGDFPPLKSLNQSNLPVQPTPFVGREKELGEVMVLLRRPETRLLSLTGAGGSGKTRLAVQAAAEVVDEHEHGVWWVPLQAVRDPERVVGAIASVVGAGGDLAEHVGAKRMLLVLDNFEQVTAAAPALGELLAACPNLRLLVTSRELLRLAAEREYPVPPLVEQESVGFFLARARAVRPGFEVDENVLPICRRVDHLPLALELAAARVKALSTAQILERLDRSLPLLTGGSRDAPERQQTLSAAIAWSYDLLSPNEQRLFRRLAVFSGGCTLEAAEQAVGADLDTLQSLVEKSLLRFQEERYSMLQTIREFALHELEESGEAEDVRRAHADFFLAFGEEANVSAEGDYGRRYDLIPPDQDNFRAVLDWALATGEIELGLRLASMLENFWVIADPFEGMRRFESLLARAADVDPVVRARALRCYGGCNHVVGRFEESQRASEESLALFRAAGDDEGVAVVLHRLAVVALPLGETERARELLTESAELSRRIGSRRSEAEVIGTLGHIAESEGNMERALELYAESGRLALEVDFRWWYRGMVIALANGKLELGRVDDAEPDAWATLEVSSELADRRGLVWGLVLNAWVAAARGDAGRAGRLWGAIEAEEKRGPIGQWEDERATYAARLSAVEGQEFDEARAKGARLSLEQAANEVLSSRPAAAGAP